MRRSSAVRVVTWSLALCLIAATQRARGDERSTSTARELFTEGSDSFERGDYERAFGLFRRSFLVEPRAELRYDMAVALERLGRRGEAADELRGYLLARPDAPRRAELEARVRELSSEQGTHRGDRTVRLELLPAAMASPPAPLWKRWWPWTILGVGVAAGVAIGLGVGLTRGVQTTLPATGPGLALHF